MDLVKWLEHPEYVDFMMGFIPGHEENEIRDEFQRRFGITLNRSQIKNFKTKYKIKSGTYGGCFKKGGIPHNKGKKMPQSIYAQCSKTMFRKGNIPPNHRPVGSERLNADGYIEVKVEEPSKWKLKQRLIWEAMTGEKLSSNDVIIFLDQDKQNFAPENLFKLTRSELIRYNQSRLYCNNADISKAAAQIAQLKVAMKKRTDNEKST